MKKTVIDMAEFRERVKTGKQKPQSAIRLVAPMQEPVVAQEGRTVSFVFSDSSVDRYGDTIDARGWVLDNFKANPVALFGHDANSVENVIGNARNVRVEGNRLIGDIEFMPAETNPNAEVVYQMVKGGYLKTVSVGFQPLEWHLTKDKNRPGGVDFRKQELLEISIVPIPANPNALTQAKAAGLDIERIGLKADAAPLVSKKGMYDVSCLARLLAELGYLQDSSAWEAEYEGDGSEIPQRLADAMNQLGQILVDMTSEEVGELLSDRGAEEPIILHDDPTEMSLSLAQKAVHAFVRGLAAAKAKPIKQSVEIEMSQESKDLLAQIERAGKVLSGANETALRSACDHMTKAMEHVNGVIDTNQPDDVDNEDITKSADDESERERRARARKHKSRASLHLVAAE